MPSRTHLATVNTHHPLSFSHIWWYLSDIDWLNVYAFNVALVFSLSYWYIHCQFSEFINLYLSMCFTVLLARDTEPKRKDFFKSHNSYFLIDFFKSQLTVDDATITRYFQVSNFLQKAQKPLILLDFLGL